MTVDIIELGEVVAAGDLVGEFVVHAAEIEVLTGSPAEEAAVLVIEGDIFVVGIVAVLGFIQAAAGEYQILEFLGRQQPTIEGLRQNAPVVGFEDRQLGHQRTDFQLGGGDFYFAGQAQLGVFVGGAAVIMGRQQSGAGAVGAGVELDPEHAQRIHAKAHGAIGVTRLQVEHKALGPLVALGLLGTGAVAKVAIEVHVAGFQGRAAVFEEGGLAERREAGKGGGAGKGGLGQAGKTNRRTSLGLCRQHGDALRYCFYCDENASRRFSGTADQAAGWARLTVSWMLKREAFTNLSVTFQCFRASQGTGRL